MIVQKKQVVWFSDKGVELIKLKDDGTAYVAVCTAGPDTLNDLAEACSAASEALRLIAETELAAAEAT